MFNQLPKYYEEIKVEGDTFQLTLYDDFDGTELNSKIWAPCPEQRRQDAGGWWKDSMVRLDGKGNLVLTADVIDAVPISGAIRSKGKFKQAKGYFEIRCKLQSAKGFWGAFWLMCRGAKSVGNGAADGAEIDIFESNDINGQINHAIHWGGYGASHKQIACSVHAPNCYDGNFHTFSLLWTEKEYVFYIDKKETYRISEGDASYPGANTKPTYLKISTEFGSWAGAYNANELPDCLVVDYVKVYKKKN